MTVVSIVGLRSDEVDSLVVATTEGEVYAEIEVVGAVENDEDVIVLILRTAVIVPPLNVEQKLCDGSRLIVTDTVCETLTLVDTTPDTDWAALVDVTLIEFNELVDGDEISLLDGESVKVVPLELEAPGVTVCDANTDGVEEESGEDEDDVNNEEVWEDENDAKNDFNAVIDGEDEVDNERNEDTLCWGETEGSVDNVTCAEIVADIHADTDNDRYADWDDVVLEDELIEFNDEILGSEEGDCVIELETDVVIDWLVLTENISEADKAGDEDIVEETNREREAKAETLAFPDVVEVCDGELGTLCDGENVGDIELEILLLGDRDDCNDTDCGASDGVTVRESIADTVWHADIEDDGESRDEIEPHAEEVAPAETEIDDERDDEAEEEPVHDCDIVDVIVIAMEVVEFVEIVAKREIVVSREKVADTVGDGVFVDETVEDVLKLRHADVLPDIVDDTDDENEEVIELDRIELRDDFTDTEADDETVAECEDTTDIEEINELLDKGDSLAVREDVPLSEGKEDMDFAAEKLAVDDELADIVALRDSDGVCDCNAVNDVDTLAQPEFEIEV